MDRNKSRLRLSLNCTKKITAQNIYSTLFGVPLTIFIFIKNRINLIVKLIFFEYDVLVMLCKQCKPVNHFTIMFTLKLATVEIVSTFS